MGSVTVGATRIAIAQHTTMLPLNVSIAGGTISGAAGLCEKNPQNNPAEAIAKVACAMAGGTFATADDGKAIISGDKKSFITSGAFDSDPNASHGVPADGNSGYDVVFADGCHNVAD